MFEPSTAVRNLVRQSRSAQQRHRTTQMVEVRLSDAHNERARSARVGALQNQESVFGFIRCGSLRTLNSSLSPRIAIF